LGTLTTMYSSITVTITVLWTYFNKNFIYISISEFCR